MPQAVVAVAAAFASTAAAVTAVTSTVVLGLTVGTWLTVGATALSVGMAMSAAAEAKKAARGLESTGQQLQLKAAGDGAPVPFLFGRSATGGYLVYRDTYGSKNSELAMVTVLSGGGPIQGVESYTASDYAVAFGTNPNSGLATATGTSPSSELYAGKMRQRWLTGASTDGDPSSYSGQSLPGIGPQFKLSGLAHALMVCSYDTKRFPSGLPSKNLWVASGLKLYDPRKDSTYPGGSGAHRWGQPATYEWSENPGICALNWSLGLFDNGKKVGGIGATMDELDLGAFVAMANVCDANGWTVGGVVTSDDNKFSVLNAILQAGGAVAAARGAQLSVIQNAPKASVYALDTDDIVGAVEINNTAPYRDRKNTIVPRWRSEAQGWEMIAGETVTASTYVAEDGGETRSIEVQYALVQGAAQAHQLAAYDMVNGREFLQATVVCKPRLLGVRVGDCITVNVPDLAMLSKKMLVVGRSLDPSTLQVTLNLRSETDAKHPFALGQSQTAPPSPSLGGFDPSNPPAPANAAWAITGTSVVGTDGVRQPAIVVTGAVDDPNAATVIFEYRKVGVPTWTAYAETPITTTRMEITGVTAGDQYEVAVSHRSVLGVIAANKLILGPVIPGPNEIPWANGVITNVPLSLTDQINGYLKAEWIKLNGQIIPDILDDYANTIAQSQLDIIELQQNSGELALEGYAKREELDAVAFAQMTDVLMGVNEEVERKRLTYLDGVEIGNVVVHEQTRTDDAIETLDLIGVKNANATAILFNLDKVQVANGVSMASKFIGLEAATANAAATATQQFNAVSNAVSAEANARVTLSSVVANNAAVANQQFATIANTTSTLARFDQLLGARNGANTAVILNRDTVFVDATTSMTTRDNLIDSKFNGSSSSFILSTAQTASSSANAAVLTLQQMGATIGNGSAFALDATKITVSGGGNLATRLTSLQSDIDNKATSASVSSQISAATGPGSSLATSITTAQTTASGAQSTASIALSAANGNSSSIVLQAGAGGKAAYMKVNGSTSAISFVGSQFSFVDNSGTNPVVPLTYFAGNWYMTSVIAQQIAAGSINTAQINAGVVVTDHLVDNSISTPVFTYSNTTYTGVGNVTLLSASITPAKSRGIKIDFTGNFHFPSSRTTLILQLYCNGSPVYGASARASFDGQDEVPMSITFYDAFASAGTGYSYSIQKTSGTNIDWYNGSLYLQELKK